MSIFETLRERVDLIKLTERFTELNRRGNKLRGCCPFPDHQDDTPSFYCYPDRRFHCFGCRRHGDVTDLWAGVNGLEPGIEAALDLAREYAVELPEREPEAHRKAQERREKEDHYLKQAKACHKALARHAHVVEYLKRRGFGKELQECFLLGANRDGTEAVGDLLVGADGIHSRVRRVMDPKAPRPSYTGLLSLGGYAKGPRIPPTPDTQHFVFGKKAFFGYLVRESGEIWWFANVAHPDEPSTKELSGVSSAEWKRRLLDLFSGDIDLIGEIVESTQGEISAYPVHDIPTAPIWHKGPAVLVGDAVHATSPNSGQGASMAVEDALVLAKCLRDIPDIERAFAAYERLRRERVEKVVAYSRRIGQSKAISNPLARWLRDQIMPFALKHFAKADSHAWLYTYHVDWDEKVA